MFVLRIKHDTKTISCNNNKQMTRVWQKNNKVININLYQHDYIVQVIKNLFFTVSVFFSLTKYIYTWTIILFLTRLSILSGETSPVISFAK